MNLVNIFRRCLQVTVIVIFCLLPWLAALGWHEASGSLFAFEIFGIPFADPASALQTVLVSVSAAEILPATSYMLGAVLALLLAFFLGRIFCGWLCPYGFFSEGFFLARRRIIKSCKFKNTPYQAFFIKTGILILGLILVLVLGYPLVSLISFPGEISLIPLAIWQSMGLVIIFSLCAIPLLVLILEICLGRRLWCEYMCPQSVMLGLASWSLPRFMTGLRILWTPKKCICGSKSPCRDSCSMGINPRKLGGPNRRDCVMCGQCIKTCANFGHALAWKMVEPSKNPDDKSDSKK